MIVDAKVQTWSMLLETGLIGKILERTRRRGARYEGENARRKAEAKSKSVSRKVTAQRISPGATNAASSFFRRLSE
jgi:hypothetical protein